MEVRAENNASLDGVKWVIVIAIVAASIYGYHHFSEQALSFRVIGLLIAAGIAGFVAYQTAKGQAFFTLVKEARSEVRKVVWPTKQETMHTTWIVLVVVMVVGLAMFVLDWFLEYAVSKIIG
jgi:preprotein translocase subunit SecE